MRIKDTNGYMQTMMHLDLGAAAAMDVVEGLELSVRTLIDTQKDGKIDSKDFFHAKRLIVVLFAFARIGIGNEVGARMFNDELYRLQPVDARGRKVSTVHKGPSTLCAADWFSDEVEAA